MMAHAILRQALLFSALFFLLQNVSLSQDRSPGFPLENEPVAFIAHGTLFDESGEPISREVNNLLSIQRYYAGELNSLLSAAEKSTFATFRAELISQVQEVQSSFDPLGVAHQQLIVNALLFDKQLELFNPADAGRLKGINNLIKREAFEEFSGRGPKAWATLIKDSPFLRLYGEHIESKAANSSILFLSTLNGGSAYITECAGAGVPTPPAWGDAAWKPTGILANNNEFISPLEKARPYVFQSPSPVGACIALPREIGSTGVAKLLGIICVGKESGNSCFWDNQTTECDDDPDTPCPESYDVDIEPATPLAIDSAFLGGADLLGGEGGKCTGCHAGENPFVIHPGTALGHPALDVNNTTTQTMPDKFHDPIVHSSWYQNERSSTLTDLPVASRCAGCHGTKPTGDITENTKGGRLPQLSQILKGGSAYCGAVIKNAINISGTNPDNTMPFGGTLSSTQHASLVGVIDDFCDNSTDPGKDSGDPHITTTDGVRFDFQAAGEFTLLKDSRDFEIQTRQAAIPTSFFPRANRHTGVASCVSVNTGVATKIGSQRITYQSDIDGNPNPNAMELRVDGVLTNLGSTPISLAAGGRLIKSSVNGLEIEFPNGAYLSAVPGYWSSQDQWVVNISISGAEANRGIMGAVPSGSWLPMLRDGSSVGARPADPTQRYNVLNNRFADSWRVNAASSLFDYAQGAGPSSFELAGWPKSTPDCVVPNRTAPTASSPAAARQACAAVVNLEDRDNCEFDFELTGANVFVDIYEREQALWRWGTKTEVSLVSGRSKAIEDRTYAISVEPRWPGLTRQPTGSVQVSVNGQDVGIERAIDRTGLAFLEGAEIADAGDGAVITGRYIPETNSQYTLSHSPELTIIDSEPSDSGDPTIDPSAEKHHYFWLLVALFILIALILILRSRAS